LRRQLEELDEKRRVEREREKVAQGPPAAAAAASGTGAGAGEAPAARPLLEEIVKQKLIDKVRERVRRGRVHAMD